MLEKIYHWSKSKAYIDILQTLQQQWHCVVNFLYFANAMKWRLFEQPRDDKDIEYKQSLLDWDYLLPDGISLQTFYKAYRPWSLHNLNGTDFVPYLLWEITKKHSLSIYLYQCYDPAKGKTIESLQHWVDALQELYPDARLPRADQCHYTSRGEGFDREWLTKSSWDDPSEFKVFLHCTGTPFQEMWVQEHRDFFIEHWFLVLNAGGLVDYLTWFEMRAPDWVVRARVLETFWRIAKHPKKNLHKFLAMFGIFRLLINMKHFK